MTLSLPEAEIFIMIDLQIFTREGPSGRERERNQGWAEHPRGSMGGYDLKTPLWQPEKPEQRLTKEPARVWQEGVSFDFHTRQGEGIGILSRGKAEVFAGDYELIKRQQPYSPVEGLTYAPATATAQQQRAEIIFSQPGITVDLDIIVDGQPVKQVRIVSVASE